MVHLTPAPHPGADTRFRNVNTKSRPLVRSSIYIKMQQIMIYIYSIAPERSDGHSQVPRSRSAR